jgi:hypothetical protein
MSHSAVSWRLKNKLLKKIKGFVYLGGERQVVELYKQKSGNRKIKQRNIQILQSYRRINNYPFVHHIQTTSAHGTPC